MILKLHLQVRYADHDIHKINDLMIFPWSILSFTFWQMNIKKSFHCYFKQSKLQIGPIDLSRHSYIIMFGSKKLKKKLVDDNNFLFFLNVDFNGRRGGC